jgi:hypothetical protein
MTEISSSLLTVLDREHFLAEFDEWQHAKRVKEAERKLTAARRLEELASRAEAAALSDPVELDLQERHFVYRLWAEDGECLYVGQHTGFHPATRIAQHAREKTWWHEVARADYVEVLEGDLYSAELRQICDLRPRYNSQVAATL